MIFDVGDFLVMALILISLLFFRRWDKTGRSLEKVRRYADKAKGELDAIVRERELILQDLSVDLEIKDKTVREILNRAQEAQENFLKKSEELETRIENIEAHERALEELNELALRVNENLMRLKSESNYVDHVGKRLTEVQGVLEEFEDSLEQKAIEFAMKDNERFLAFRDESFSKLEKDFLVLQDNLKESDRQLALYQETMGELETHRDETLSEHLEKFRDLLDREEVSYRERFRKVAERGLLLEDEAFSSLKSKIETHNSQLEKNWMSSLEKSQETVSGMVEKMEGGFRSLKGNWENWEQDNTERLRIFHKEVKEASGHLEQSLANADASWKNFGAQVEKEKIEISSILSDLRAKTLESIEAKENSLLQEVEEDQLNFRKSIEGRFSRLEGFISDMDALEASLKASQNQVTKEVEEVFRVFDSDMVERREREMTRQEGALSQVQQEVANLERRLEELKTRAYLSVSEKLQVFEDDFFTDLKQREEEMRKALEGWRRDLDVRLEDLTRQYSREREDLEHRYGVEVKQKLTLIQEKTLEQFETFQAQIEEFRNVLLLRVRSGEEGIEVFKDELNQEISRSREASKSEFLRLMEVFKGDAGSKLKDAQKAITQKLSDFSGGITVELEGLRGEVEQTRNESENWRGILDQDQNDTRRRAEEGIAELKIHMDSSLGQLRDEFADRTEELLLSSQEERAALRKEIVSLDDQVTRLHSELEGISRESLEKLKEEAETFLLKFQKNSREFREEMDRKVRELRQSVSEAREKAQRERQNMSLQLKEESSRLGKTLEELEHRQKDFISETRVFERANELKMDLEEDIAELTKQLQAVETKHIELAPIRKEYERIIRLYEEVSDKITRFLVEQKKVETLEGKITRIVSLSESVELKLDRVTDTHDSLQDLYIRLKQLEGLNTDLIKKYGRLEKKSIILDSTVERIDKNLDQVSGLEGSIKDLEKNIIPLRTDLGIVLERQGRLLEDEERVTLIMDQLSIIDSTVKEQEERIQDLNKSREWLARIETRLESITKEAQQKVRLLGAITKHENKSAGSPDMEIREVVVKLAREGWNSEEISRNTGLSRAEVELILELMPRE